MNTRKLTLAGAAALAALALSPAVSLAQHGEHGAAEHGAGEHAPPVDHGHAGAGEPGHGTESPASHADHGEAHPEAINWTDFNAPPRPDHASAHDPHPTGTHPAPKPFLASAINFAILVGLLIWAVKKVVNPALASRRAAVESELGEAQRLRAEAEAMHREYTERLAGLTTEVAALRNEFVQAGERERDRIVADARAKAERMRKDGEFVIQQEIKQLRSDLTREAVEAAVASAEQTVRAQTGAADQTRLADAYLADLDKQPSGAKGAVS